MVKLSFVIFEKLFWQAPHSTILGTDHRPRDVAKECNLCVMTHIEKPSMTKLAIYGLRNWVEYGLKQSKNELGWADFRVTNYAQIERWWEMVMSAFIGQSPHKRIASASTTTSDPTRCSTPSNRAQTHNIRGNQANVETGAQQFAFSDSALGDLEFASTLVESISDSTLISRIRVFSCTDESLPKSLALPRPTGRLPLFSA